MAPVAAILGLGETELQGSLALEPETKRLDLMETASNLPRVVADGPLAEAVTDLLAGKVSLLPWDAAVGGGEENFDALYTQSLEQKQSEVSTTETH